MIWEMISNTLQVAAATADKAHVTQLVVCVYVEEDLSRASAFGGVSKHFFLPHFLVIWLYIYFAILRQTVFFVCIGKQNLPCRICNLVMDMRKADETLDTDQKIITALCTDLDAMCEIMAIVLCNHLFTPSGNLETWESVKTKNDYYISVMKAVVMQSTYDANQWAAIVLGAIKSIDLSAFFLLKKSVSTLTDSLLTRKKKSEETASLFMEALSLQTQQTSSEHSPNTD